MNDSRCSRLTILAALALTALVCDVTLAPPPGGGNGNGNGNGNGGGGGGGGGDPPPDPAIVYMHVNGRDVMVMNADGSSTATVIKRANSQPTMSADGTFIVMGAEIGGIDGIWTIDPDGANLQLVTATTATRPDLYRPTVSPVPAPDGEYKIAFVDELVLWLVNLDGSGRHVLTYTDGEPVGSTHVAWSIDATRLAITLAGNPVIADLDLVDGLVQVVDVLDLSQIPGSPLVDAQSVGFPAWANTQDLVVFSLRIEEENHELWLIDLIDPGFPEQLTFTDAGDRWASFAPDDSYLVFSRGGEILQRDWLGNETNIGGGSRTSMRRFDEP